MIEYEVNIWSVIYRIRDLNRKKDEAEKAEQQNNDSKYNHQHNMVGYSSVDEYEQVLLTNNVSVVYHEESSDQDKTIIFSTADKSGAESGKDGAISPRSNWDD